MAQAKSKLVKVRAEYPFCDVPVGDTQTLWGVDFVHTEVKQGDEVFNVLVAEIDEGLAAHMFDCGRVTKA